MPSAGAPHFSNYCHGDVTIPVHKTSTDNIIEIISDKVYKNHKSYFVWAGLGYSNINIKSAYVCNPDFQNTYLIFPSVTYFQIIIFVISYLFYFRDKTHQEPNHYKHHYHRSLIILAGHI